MVLSRAFHFFYIIFFEFGFEFVFLLFVVIIEDFFLFEDFFFVILFNIFVFFARYIIDLGRIEAQSTFFGFKAFDGIGFFRDARRSIRCVVHLGACADTAENQSDHQPCDQDDELSPYRKTSLVNPGFHIRPSC